MQEMNPFILPKVIDKNDNVYLLARVGGSS